MSTGRRRRYVSAKRERAAGATRGAVLRAARALFVRRGIDVVTIAAIANRAGVSTPTVYSLYGSKAGILQAVMERALFGPRYRDALKRLEGETDAGRLIALTAAVARSIYESESKDLGLLRGAAAFSPELRRTEREFERRRMEMQEARIRLLFEQRKAKPGLTVDRARQILWMYTSRDIYRMLVDECGWSADRYQAWLSQSLVEALVLPVSRG